MVCVKKEVSQESKSDTNMNGWISIPSVIIRVQKWDSRKGGAPFVNQKKDYR